MRKKKPWNFLKKKSNARGGSYPTRNLFPRKILNTNTKRHRWGIHWTQQPDKFEFWWYYRATWTLTHSLREWKLVWPLWKIIWCVYKSWPYVYPRDICNRNAHIYLNQKTEHKNIQHSTIHNSINWKPPKCPSIASWNEKLLHIHMIGYSYDGKL